MPNITTYQHFIGDISLPKTANNGVIDSYLNETITRVEPRFLSEVLGYSLYQLLMTNISQTSGIYYDLLNGADFTDKNGLANHFEGLKGIGTCPMANLVYYTIQDEKYSTTQTIGEKKAKAENSTDVNPVYKMVKAWNNMVDMLWIMDDFLRQKNTANSSYAEYIGLTYPPYIGECGNIPNNKYFQKENIYGI